MKKINIFKSLRTLVFALVGLVLAGGVFFACQNHNDDAPEGDALLQEGVEYPIPENAIVLVEPISFVQQGELGWYDTEGKGDPVWFGGAAFYYLPKDIKNYETFSRLIQGDKEVPYTILKITLGEQKEAKMLGTPIINVELPSLDELQEVERIYANTNLTRRLKIQNFVISE